MADRIDSDRVFGKRLRVIFSQAKDRVSHAIVLLDENDAECGRLNSQEGDASEPWPMSPALQNLHIEERAGSQRVALLVGQAGKSHWSLSVEPVAGEAALRFDVACRVNAPPRWMGSSYVASAAEHFVFQSADAVVETGERLMIRPRSLPSELKGPVTIRWSYVVRCS